MTDPLDDEPTLPEPWDDEPGSDRRGVLVPLRTFLPPLLDPEEET